MFKKLFGNGGAPANKQPVQQNVDAGSTMEKLQDQIDNVDKRSKVLENKITALKMEALQKKKAKDTRGMNSLFLTN